MHTKLEFIDDFSAEFLRVGKHDEEELHSLGKQSFENISLELDALHCLRFFSNINNLILRPGRINENDIYCLDNLPVKRLKLDYYSDSLDEYTIDLSVFENLEHIFSRTQYNFRNVEKCGNLKSLVVQEWCSSDLSYLKNVSVCKIKMLSGKLKKLEGIHQFMGLKYLSLSNQRFLADIADLQRCQGLEELEIESCGRIQLDSFPSIESLHTLILIGRQTIENCSFFFRFPNLKKLILGMKIMDSDTSSLLRLKHCAILTDSRHYTHKNADLPKL